MRLRWLVLVLACSCVLNSASGAEETNDAERAWIAISAAAQNAHYDLKMFEEASREIVRRDGGAAGGQVPDLSAYEAYIEKIDAALRVLTKAKRLVRKEFVLLTPGELGGAGIQSIQDFVEDGELAKTFGYYTSLELIDLGVRRHFMAAAIDEPVKLTVHLPAKQMKKFDAMLVKKQLLAKPKNPS